MDITFDMFTHIAHEGDIYFFEKDCPYGVANHPHILIKVDNKYVFLSTCSSQKETPIRLAKSRNWNIETYPYIKSDDMNKLSKECSYVDCNNIYEIEGEKFMNLLRKKVIHAEVGGGRLSDDDFQRVLHGLKISTNIQEEKKDKIFGK